MHDVAMSSTEHNLWLTANILGLVVVVASPPCSAC
jgi:hypothetical protein